MRTQPSNTSETARFYARYCKGCTRCSPGVGYRGRMDDRQVTIKGSPENVCSTRRPQAHSTPEADISSAIVSVGKGPQENLDRQSEIQTGSSSPRRTNLRRRMPAIKPRRRTRRNLPPWNGCRRGSTRRARRRPPLGSEASTRRRHKAPRTSTPSRSTANPGRCARAGTLGSNASPRPAP